MRLLRSAVTWLGLFGVWLFVCWLLWQAAATGLVPDPRRYSTDVVSVHDQPLAFAVSIVFLCLGFLGIPAFAWVSWREARQADRSVSRPNQRLDNAIRRDRDA